MKKSRLLAAALAGVLSLSLLAGCGPTASDPGTSPSASQPSASQSGAPATEPSAEGVNIVWAGWSGEEEASKDIFQRMMDTYEQQSGNTVTWVGWTWADTAQQLLIRTQGGEQLDLAQVDIGIFNTVAQAGVLADWNEILGEDYMKETFEQSALDVGNIDGQQLGMPWSMASISMVYNPEILAAAGWDEVPVTIAEFEQCLADIKASNPDVVPYAVSTKDATCAGDFMPWLWTFGGAIFNEDGSVAINSDAAVACVEWYQSLMEKGYIAMDTGRGEARQLFAQGKVAFYDDAVLAKGQAVSNGVDPDEVVNVCSAMNRPVLNEGDQPQSTMWGHMLVVFKDSEYKEQAAELAQTLVSDEVAMDYFTNNGMPPVTKSAAALDEVKNDAYLNGFLESTSTARLEETARMANANEVKTIITEELQYALLGQKTAEQAVSDMAARLEAL
ncbi:MAG: sugar ABC transporter substrate-binding protein [Pseudoflavonifractor capillosus]|uniref:ABC transporter substrate-binding protein n=1 Tax=Pseudoflavonifractor capillosus TaxID=106588 RepID=UPI0023FA1E9D|nr:sugar ABC transporter substrate-binding protein [Pseudoflavonifractor capillosus]MCI5928577.1 sugar ABC transporter substrate-binding protein [Pseudoflavonifractor capillosus]MDY4661537.1 sugar ABC transporter substrate-binding protein [Pseudoflavonifractor capillosus]